MSKIQVKFQMLFDTDETWRNVSDFQGSLSRFFEDQHLLAEVIQTGKNDDMDFNLCIYKDPAQDLPVLKHPTVKQQIAKVSTMRDEKGKYTK